MGSEDGRRLIDFTFRGSQQDYAWWLEQPYWAEKYQVDPKRAVASPSPQLSPLAEEDVEETTEQTYTLADVLEDGCFVTLEKLQEIYDRWTSKKNLILQGPPGTGKTWLAKRLGFVRVGSNDRETTRSRLRVVQFHPSLAYEDFVRGWRPNGEKLALVDGILMQAIEAAASEPDRPFVLVIEEINRGNPAQILGEMLTLLENTKRRASEAIELAYRKSVGERVYVPDNLFVIGTMNVADRSLAIVDLALRRRFAFADLEPELGPAWRGWCQNRGLDGRLLTEIENRMAALNADITSATSLGAQFRIGHSYVTPDLDEQIANGTAWFRAKVETEIGPLLDEYWYDSLETARAARAKLLGGLS
jgi:5-methylcytosine-specific restriction protein B